MDLFGCVGMQLGHEGSFLVVLRVSLSSYGAQASEAWPQLKQAGLLSQWHVGLLVP